MSGAQSDRDYWENRARARGAAAAGYRDPDMDAYDDRLRRLAIERALGAGDGRTLMDAGCGSGRWCVRLAAIGWKVTGVDFSEELIRLAPPAAGVTYVRSAIEDLGMPDSSFDAWLSVTALQHITSPKNFEAALRNLTRMTRPGGRGFLLEFSPLLRVGRTDAHLAVRTRRQWIEALTSAGYRTEGEVGVRFVGHLPYIAAVRLWRRAGGTARSLNWLRAVCWALDRALSRAPLITRLADVHLFLLVKVAS